jgi:hypothetical protein
MSLLCQPKFGMERPEIKEGFVRPTPSLQPRMGPMGLMGLRLQAALSIVPGLQT